VKLVNMALGSSVQDFQFEACSGDRTGGIYQQVDNIKNDLDLVMMTAGGNDLCLAAMIKTCVILPWDGEDACQTILDKAQENIDTILKPNIREVLNKLNGKIRKDGALIYSGYAPFFNTENEDCATKQNWALRAWNWLAFWNWFRSALKLTISRRDQFNKLVDNINKAISEVVEEYDKDRDIRYRATFSDWSSWPGIVDGQFCSPSSSGAYPDPNQPGLLFYKFNTKKGSSDGVPPHDEIKRRSLDGPLQHDESEAMREHLDEYRARLRGRLTREHLYDTLLYKSPNPRAEALHKLNPRAPEPPGCPGDGVPGVPLGLGLPDSFLSIFHPNPRGHEAMAGYALQNLVWLRAQILDVDDGLCAAARDDFTCWQKEGRKAFVDFKRVDENYKDFCESVDPPSNTINWKFEKKYHEGTPDEHDFKIQLLDGASSYDKQQCLDSFDRIINSCDGSDPENPLNFKFGGRWVRGNYDYSLSPKKDRKMMKKRDGTCYGNWYVFFTTYKFEGRGWATYDHGQKTLLDSARACGAALTGVSFDYCDDCDDWEWRAKFNAPVYFAIGCFRNNWVAHRAGGETHHPGDPDKLGCGGPNA
jgi:lysophospholipase L1-like esterase